jgi:uncharacterized protein (DUF1778 family)
VSHLDKLLEQNSTDEKTVSFKLPEQKRDQLTDACEARGVNRSAFIAAAVLDALDKLEQ